MRPLRRSVHRRLPRPHLDSAPPERIEVAAEWGFSVKMLKNRRRLPAAIVLSLALSLPGAAALAQNASTVGPPQLRDFQLKGERRPAPAQPQPQPAPAPTPPPAADRPAPSSADPPPARERAPAPRADRRNAEPRPAPPPGAAIPSRPQDIFQLPDAPAANAPAAAPQTGAPPATGGENEPISLWLYLVTVALAGLGAVLLLRRRRRHAAAVPVQALVAEADPAPRPAPVPRPWLELELKAERAASTESEAWVEFEMVVRNTGKSTARNIRINARMFNAGNEQDKEIGAFFKTKGEGRRTHVIPELPAGERGLIQGTVTMPREEMRALQVNEQLLFIPVVGVNTVYDWGEGRTGQTSKSYVIGRELGAASAKMGAFRLDLGPRIYRTVGQRQHNLAKRV